MENIKTFLQFEKLFKSVGKKRNYLKPTYYALLLLRSTAIAPNGCGLRKFSFLPNLKNQKRKNENLL